MSLFNILLDNYKYINIVSTSQLGFLTIQSGASLVFSRVSTTWFTGTGFSPPQSSGWFTGTGSSQPLSPPFSTLPTWRRPTRGWATGNRCWPARITGRTSRARRRCCSATCVWRGRWRPTPRRWRDWGSRRGAPRSSRLWLWVRTHGRQPREAPLWRCLTSCVGGASAE